MTKYIVKNCPALKNYANPKTVGWCNENATYCQCVTDCPIKQVVELCKAEYEAAGRQLDGISEEVLQQLPQLYFLRGCRNVAYQILQMFQVEEVE